MLTGTRVHRPCTSTQQLLKFDLLQGRVASETHTKGQLIGGNYFYGPNITLE
jgi:hypothetical protein